MKGLLYKTIQIIWRLTLKTIYYKYRMRLDIKQYESRKPIIEKRVFSKKRINVVFFVINLGMWKNDYLFGLLLKDKRFNPMIVSFPLPSDNIERQKAVLNEIESYFKIKGYPFEKGFDFENNKCLDPLDLHPDIVFYAQPYRNGYPFFDVKHLWKDSLFIYVPYCILMEKGDRFSNTLIQNIAWKVFLPTRAEMELYRTSFSKGNNCLVTGSPVADYICTEETLSINYWKGRGKKKVIWAPHHSILKTDTLNYSNFLEIADDMVELARKYDNIVDFAFKPHPMLKDKLYNLPEWGFKRTDEYYNLWKTMPNTSLCDGIYYDLFRSSDGLIHDCSSFSAEYLYTEKPVMYLSKKDHVKFLNQFGVECYNLHYKGKSIEDVYRFIEEVIIGGQDGLYDKRIQFKHKCLNVDEIPVSQKMYNEINIEF